MLYTRQSKYGILLALRKTELNCVLYTDIPLQDLLKNPSQSSTSEVPVAVLCRRGNDSLVATRALREAGINARDVVGGLQAWSRTVDPQFPTY